VLLIAWRLNNLHTQQAGAQGAFSTCLLFKPLVGAFQDSQRNASRLPICMMPAAVAACLSKPVDHFSLLLCCCQLQGAAAIAIVVFTAVAGITAVWSSFRYLCPCRVRGSSKQQQCTYKTSGSSLLHLSLLPYKRTGLRGARAAAASSRQFRGC
jgi:hypothetical protein